MREAQEVLDFWFGAEPGASRREWFVKDPSFDAKIRERFGDLTEAAVRGERDAWREDPRATLALVVALDQFTRNLHRGDARAFAGDARALDVARHALARGDEQVLRPVERQFLYMPFEHSEDLADQEQAVALMRSLEQYPETRGLTEWAEKHRVIVERFGRFPHRNAALGRASTAEELAFLSQPGSSF